MRKKLLMCSSARMGIHFNMIPPKDLSKIETFSFAISFLLKIIKLPGLRLDDYLSAGFICNPLLPNSLPVNMVRKAKNVRSVNNWLG